MPVNSIASGKGAEKEGKNHRLNRILFGSVAMAALLGGGLYLLKRFVWRKLPLWLPVVIPLLIGFFCASPVGEAIAGASTVTPASTAAPAFTEKSSGILSRKGLIQQLNFRRD